jgi:hypothetical protein
LKDLNRAADQINMEVASLERWRERFLEAIANGSVTLANGQRQQLDETRGIDILGDIMESSQLNPNPNLYG